MPAFYSFVYNWDSALPNNDIKSEYAFVGMHLFWNLDRSPVLFKPRQFESVILKILARRVLSSSISKQYGS